MGVHEKNVRIVVRNSTLCSKNELAFFTPAITKNNVQTAGVAFSETFCPRYASYYLSLASVICSSRSPRNRDPNALVIFGPKMTRKFGSAFLGNLKEHIIDSATFHKSGISELTGYFNFFINIWCPGVTT